MLKEFKAFVMRGNVLDLAIAVITPHLRSVQVSAAHKECTYCFTTISIKATRCPHCTSEIKVASNK